MYTDEINFEGLGRWDAKVVRHRTDGITIIYWERTEVVATLRKIRVDTDLEMVQFLHGLAEAE